MTRAQLLEIGFSAGIAYEVDLLWRAQRLILETDGGRFHSTRSQIERDRRKESDLVRAATASCARRRGKSNASRNPSHSWSPPP